MHIRGWRKVYSFTFNQTLKTSHYKLVTALVAFLLVATIIVINCIVAKPDKAPKPLDIEKVYVVDNSGLPPVDYRTILDTLENVKCQNITFSNVTDATAKETLAKLADDSSKSVVVSIDFVDGSFVMKAGIPNNSEVSNKQANSLLKQMDDCFEMSKIVNSGLTVEQIQVTSIPVITSVIKVGDNDSLAAELIKVFAPMAFGLLLYMLLLTYGQTISKEVSTEKTSKLMETMLTSTNPQAMILGKVLAIVSLALIQFLIWVAALIGAVFAGNMVAKLMFPEYNSSVVAILKFIRNNVGDSALTISAIILAIIVFCMGFVFYSMISGLAGGLVSKPEDVSAMQSIFVLPIVISWLVCYMSALYEKEKILAVVRYIPFTAPFCVPIELLTGTLEIGLGVISCAIMVVSSLVIVVLAARIYKGLVLYKGEKLSLKTVWKVIKK